MGGPEVSHGRGGAGNINPDDTKYVDGEIVRAGAEGHQGAGAYSTGRGGDGNIAEPGVAPTKRTDEDLVPEAALRVASEEDVDVHLGRGGAGNVHLGPEHQKQKITDGAAHDQKDRQHVGLADKLKNRVLKLFKK